MCVHACEGMYAWVGGRHRGAGVLAPWRASRSSARLLTRTPRPSAYPRAGQAAAHAHAPCPRYVGTTYIM